MKINIVTITGGIIILFFGLVILPMYYIGILNWRTDAVNTQIAARNFVDMVIDNGYVTEKALTDLNLTLSGCYGTYTYEYYRDEKVTNPNPDDPSKAEVSWIKTEVTEDTVWRSGDIITIVIKQRGVNLLQRISMNFLGSSYNTLDIRLAGMVR